MNFAFAFVVQIFLIALLYHSLVPNKVTGATTFRISSQLWKKKNVWSVSSDALIPFRYHLPLKKKKRHHILFPFLPRQPGSSELFQIQSQAYLIRIIVISFQCGLNILFLVFQPILKLPYVLMKKGWDKINLTSGMFSHLRIISAICQR